ncbi:unnamed protein product [Polarella glacialis]|uniref:GPI-anchor transamidase n=1 Tax=Polarella glacialis TaxID=89957 RepID=A0A813H593_POLGL|nr:unnamed protein product [Polarella glacialis]
MAGVRWLLRLIAAAAVTAAGSESQDAGSVGAQRNNWAVLVDTSRYWYNYRHAANVLSFYHTVKRLGIPDSQILLMLAEDAPCNARNARPGTVFNDRHRRTNLYGEEVEVDYRGDEVNVENFIRLLTGRHHPSTPRNKRLLTDSSSNIFIFITGHSGDEFIKFQDWEEMTTNDIGDAFKQMEKQRRYGQIFWIADTCQASTLHKEFYSPGIVAYGSSRKNENSYSHHSDPEIGIALIDRFTYYALDGLQRMSPSSTETLESFTKWFRNDLLNSKPEMRTDLFGRDVGSTLLTEFLAANSRPLFQSNLLQLASDPRRGLDGLGTLGSQRLFGARSSERCLSGLSPKDGAGEASCSSAPGGWSSGGDASFAWDSPEVLLQALRSILPPKLLQALSSMVQGTGSPVMPHLVGAGAGATEGLGEAAVWLLGFAAVTTAGALLL